MGGGQIGHCCLSVGSERDRLAVVCRELKPVGISGAINKAEEELSKIV